MKKLVAGLVASAALLTPVALTTATAEAAPVSPPPKVSTSGVVAGRSCTVVMDRWSLWHAQGTYQGYREYYGPGRFFKTDARSDCAAYLG